MDEANLFKHASADDDASTPRAYRTITKERDGFGYSSLMTQDRAGEMARDGVEVLRIEKDVAVRFTKSR